MTTSNPEKLKPIETSAKFLIAKHLGEEWKFKWNKSVNCLGICKYKTKTIEISMKFALELPMEETKNTILHEIGHAITGPGHGYDETWKKNCRLIGLKDPKATAKIDFSVDSEKSWNGYNTGDELVIKASGNFFKCTFEYYVKRQRKAPVYISINGEKSRIPEFVVCSKEESADLLSKKEIPLLLKENVKASQTSTLEEEQLIKKPEEQKEVKKETVNVTKKVKQKKELKKKTEVKQETKVTQASLINDMLEAKEKEEKIVKALVKTFNKDEKWAVGRLKFHLNWLAKRK